VKAALVPRSSGELLLLGAVRGHVDDVPPLLARLEQFSPRRLGVGLSFDEMTGLNDHFVHHSSEPLVSLTQSETSEVLGLAKFGEVRVPHPAYVAVLEWARDRGLAVEALEPSDERFATMFTDHIGYVELVRRTLRERSLVRKPPEAASADVYAVNWDASIASGRGSRSFARARERVIAEAAMKLAAPGGRAAAVVDRERFDGVEAVLRSEPGAR